MLPVRNHSEDMAKLGGGHEKEAYKVLIVDDEEIVCRGLAQFIKWREYGFEVVGTACSVDEALVYSIR